MDVKEIGWENVGWLYLSQNRGKQRVLVNMDDELSGSIISREGHE
jgi:hypothetical protein